MGESEDLIEILAGRKRWEPTHSSAAVINPKNQQQSEQISSGKNVLSHPNILALIGEVVKQRINAQVTGGIAIKDKQLNKRFYC